MAPLKKRLKNDLIYGAVVSLIALLRLLPRRTARGVMQSLAGLGYRLARHEREKTLRHLSWAFAGEKNAEEIAGLARAVWRHFGGMAADAVRMPAILAGGINNLVREHGVERLKAALARGKGVIVLTGHFGNWEVATIAGVRQVPEAHGRFHFVRRAIKPRWLEAMVTRRFRKAGFGVLPKRGSLDALVERLEAGDLVVFPFDQHARGRDGIVVDFFGHPAGTFRSLAIIAQATGAPVMPAASWREPDGSHVLRFEEPLEPIACDGPSEELRRNTRAYNAALERLVVRHPEQWWWVHRRWKAG